MPVARKYGPQQVARAALPGAFISPEAGGTALSEGAGLAEAKARTRQTVARFGEQVADIGVQMFARQQEERRREIEEARRRAIELNVIEGENKIASWERSRIYDPNKGALLARGKDAMGLPEQIDEEFEQVSGSIAETMATPEAKLAFERVRSNRRDNIAMAVRRHVDKEIQTYTATELKARIENGVDAAITMATTADASGNIDLRAAAAELRQTEAAFRSQAPSLGLGPEQIDEQVQSMHTQVHEGVINQLVADGKPEAARRYLAEARDDIDPERLDDIQRTVQAGTTKKQAQIETEKILTAGGTLEQQRAKAKQIDDPDVQDEVLSRLEHEATLKERQERDAHRELTKGIADRLDRTRSIASVPANEWAALEPSERSAFRSYVKQLIEKGDVDTDLKTYYSQLRAATADPLKWAQETNLEGLINKLGKTEFKQLADLQADIISGDRKKAEATVQGYLTSNQVVMNAFGKAGLDTTPAPGTPEAEQFYRLQSAIDERVRALKAGLPPGKEPSTQDIQAIADELLINVTLQRGEWLGFLTSAPFTDVQKRLGEITIADMPANLRKQAEDSLRRAGRTVSDGELLNLYRRYLLDQQKQGGR